jgi:hypothetical protein
MPVNSKLLWAAAYSQHSAILFTHLLKSVHAVNDNESKESVLGHALG